MDSGDPFELVARVEVSGVFVFRSLTPFNAFDFGDLVAALGEELIAIGIVVRAVSDALGTDDDRTGVGRVLDAVFFEESGVRLGLGVEPGDFDGVAMFGRGELEPDLAGGGEGVEVVSGGFGDNFGRELFPL